MPASVVPATAAAAAATALPPLSHPRIAPSRTSPELTFHSTEEGILRVIDRRGSQLFHCSSGTERPPDGPWASSGGTTRLPHRGCSSRSPAGGAHSACGVQHVGWRPLQSRRRPSSAIANRIYSK